MGEKTEEEKTPLNIAKVAYFSRTKKKSAASVQTRAVSVRATIIHTHTHPRAPFLAEV